MFFKKCKKCKKICIFEEEIVLKIIAYIFLFTLAFIIFLAGYFSHV
jgi:hypothetical protein